MTLLEADKSYRFWVRVLRILTGGLVNPDRDKQWQLANEEYERRKRQREHEHG